MKDKRNGQFITKGAEMSCKAKAIAGQERFRHERLDQFEFALRHLKLMYGLNAPDETSTESNSEAVEECPLVADSVPPDCSVPALGLALRHSWFRLYLRTLGDLATGEDRNVKDR